MEPRAAFVLRLASSVSLLGALCACDVIGRALQPPVPEPAPAPAPATPAPVPQGLPQLPQGLPQLPQGLPQLPQGLPQLPQGLPQLGGSLLSDRPPPASLPAPPRDAFDAQGRLAMPFMEAESARVFEQLRRALRPAQRSRVLAVPFHVVEDRVEPNAAAGCTPGAHRPLVFITSAMLVLAGGIAEARAFDELAGTHHYEAYADALASWIEREEPIGPVPAGLLEGPFVSDPRRLARARHLFTQQVAFILGHELAHHYRGHTGCIDSASVSRREAEELQRGLAQAIPPLEQPNEVEADVWGISSALEAGHALSQGAWSEEGALLNLDVFRRLSRFSTGDLALVFLSTHPPSELRAPIVRAAAQAWQPGHDPLPTPEIRGDGVDIDLGGGGGPIHIPLPIP